MEGEGDLAMSLTLYKYAKLDASTLANLVNETIYFNRVENFNDPMDSAFRILTGGEAIADNGSRLVEDLLAMTKSMCSKYVNEAKSGDSAVALTQIPQLLKAALLKYLGVSCFS